MPRFYFTIAFLLAFLLVTGGLQWMQVAEFPKAVWATFGSFAIAALLFELIIQKYYYTIQLNSILRNQWGFFLLCIIAGATFAFLRVAQTTSLSEERFLTKLVGSFVTLRGVIRDAPDLRPMQTKYTVRIEGENVLVTDYAAWPRHEYGDEVLVSGMLKRPGMIEDFEYDRYLSRYGIFVIMPRATVETIATGHGHPFFTFLFTLKERFERQINRLYPEPHASFLAGLLTGSRRGIPDHLLEDFRSTGLTHIIAISGYNITIVLALVSGFLCFLPLRWRFLPLVAAISFFTLFVGASPSVVRAAIMGALGLFALQVGRRKHSLIAILLTAFLMVAWNPKLLWYDAGFQLSFLAVLGITYLSPFLERAFQIIPETFAIRESLVVTMGAQLAAVPLVALLFGEFSLIAPLANLLVAPLIPLAMLCGFLGVFLSYFSFPVGLSLSYVSWGALELIIRIAETLANLPYASLHVPSGNHTLILAYYALLLLGVWILTIGKQRSAVPASPLS